MVTDPSRFSDVACSLCGRHNREVRVVATSAGPVICQVCVAQCAEIFDDEAGLAPPPGGWRDRWPLKR
ncbi:MAG TPA: ClpX C4-type zinc finger protein [Streptosporangiaceae bacterium]|nr:ClpX C4-type zinc finger protein [Streptosporangiaceae bacterium]